MTVLQFFLCTSCSHIPNNRIKVVSLPADLELTAPEEVWLGELVELQAWFDLKDDITWLWQKVGCQKTIVTPTSTTLQTCYPDGGVREGLLARFLSPQMTVQSRHGTTPCVLCCGNSELTFWDWDKVKFKSWKSNRVKLLQKIRAAFKLTDKGTEKQDVYL